MSEDLSTQPEEEQPIEEAYVEYTTREDYISSSFYAISAIDGFDGAIMTAADARRIKSIQRKCLRIISECVDEMYNELFDEDKNNES